MMNSTTDIFSINHLKVTFLKFFVSMFYGSFFIHHNHNGTTIINRPTRLSLSIIIDNYLPKVLILIIVIEKTKKNLDDE